MGSFLESGLIGRPLLKLWDKRAGLRLILIAAVLLCLGLSGWAYFVRMPGRSWKGPAPELSPRGFRLSERLRDDVFHLAGFGERSPRRPKALEAAADWIEKEFKSAGLQTGRQTYEADGRRFQNIEARIAGTSGPENGIVILGAHYDSVENCPGANDNGSGVAALLALARTFAARTTPALELRFVAFTMEEYYFSSHHMGSGHYARRCREKGEAVKAMLSLETMGYYSDKKGSQKYPLRILDLLYPSRGNFIAFVGNGESRRLVRGAVGAFRSVAQIPSEGLAAPRGTPGTDLSDHLSFWREGYPALMVTDTAPFRYDYYHSPLDTPERLDYPNLARVVLGLETVTELLTAP